MLTLTEGKGKILTDKEGTKEGVFWLDVGYINI